MNPSSSHFASASPVSADHAKLLDCLRDHAGIDAEKALPRIVALTPDASTRKYFRIPWSKPGTAVAALYTEAFDAETLPFLDVTRLFERAGLPIPRILAVDEANGIVVQEDLGDVQLIDAHHTKDEEEREAHIEDAIDLIARIQATTADAHTTNSIASRLAFDEEKLAWELNFFVEHFFGSLRRTPLPADDELRNELHEIAVELAARPRVLCHRDFHGANIIVDSTGTLRIIDYQDARMGAASYDLVSLLLDRQSAPPSLAEMRERRLYFLERRRTHGLPAIDPDEFACEFRLMTIQRELKAAGTFSYQTAVCQRAAVYGKYIKPTLEIVLQSAIWLNRFPHLQRTLAREIAQL